MIRYSALAFSVLLMTGCAAEAEKNTVSAQVKAALEKREPWELFSLDPDQGESAPSASPPPAPAPEDPVAAAPQPATPVPAPVAADAFHGWKVLGKTTVKDAEVRKRLVAAFLQGVAENEGVSAGCFNPRHGIRMVHDGRTIDLVICFECYQVAAYVGDTRVPGCLITRSPQPTFGGVLKDAKVPLPEKRK